MKKIFLSLFAVFFMTVSLFLYSEILKTAGSKVESIGSIKRIKLGSVNIYLLKAREGFLLIDTAFAGSFHDFKEQMKTLKISLSEIKYILLTHHHDDHAGFAADLIKDTGAILIVHRQAVFPLSKGRSLHTVKPANVCSKTVFEAFSILKKKKHDDFGYSPVVLSKEDLVVDGDDNVLLDKIGIKGKILYSPGHTSDSISVVLEDGNAFVGDVAMNIMGFCGLNHRPIYAEDMNKVYESWRRLLNMGAKIIYSSHGEPFSREELIGAL